MRSSRKFGTIVLCVWLVLMGLMQAVKLEFVFINLIAGGLAIAAAVLLFLDR